MPDGRTAAPTQAEALYALLKTNLMTGVFRPGQKLSIRTLAEGAGTSMSPVREALKRLASERALSGEAKRSYVVPALSPARAADLFQLRALLECEAARLACPRLDTAGLAALRATIQQMDAALGDGDFDGYMARNHAFHFLLYQRCGNPDMIAMIEQLWMQTGPSLRAGLAHATPDATWTEVHTDVLRACRAKDTDGLRRALLRDIRWNWDVPG